MTHLLPDALKQSCLGRPPVCPRSPARLPLVATRPAAAPWVNPPLRSMRWIEDMLSNLTQNGFSDDQVLITYRSFNSFLLGYLLLETSAMAIDDPKPGDGSFQTGDDTGSHDPVDPTDPIPGSVSPTRTTREREQITHPNETTDLIGADPDQFPVIHRLRDGLTEDRFEEEFDAGLQILLQASRSSWHHMHQTAAVLIPLLQRPHEN